MAIDVTVRGAGVFGLSCAWAMARRGARVRVVDPHGPGAGASGGIVGALAPHVPERWNPKKQFQLESLTMAEPWWAAVAEIGGSDPGYARSGRLQPIADAEALARAEERSTGAATHWPEACRWDIIDAPPDWAPASPTGRVIHDTLSARLHPRHALDALEAALRALGGVVTTDAPEEGAVLHATGWHGLEALRDDKDRPAGTGVKGQAVLLALDRREQPQLYAHGLHVVPHFDGTVAVGSTSETGFETEDTTDTQLDAVLARARAAVPALRDAEVLARWAGVRPRARSRGPLLGAWPGRDGHFIANGGFKIGFGIAPLVAEVMADLILEGLDRVPKGYGTEGLARWDGGS